MDWKSEYTLGQTLMDATHHEFVDVVNRLEAAGPEAVPAAVATLIEHTIAHFDQENMWMEACGFPPIHCHVGEHMRVIESLKSIQRMVEKGNSGLGKVLAKEMEAWFAQHAATMDSALAYYMEQVSYTPEALVTGA